LLCFYFGKVHPRPKFSLDDQLLFISFVDLN
jgi:hypothetical protein